MKKFVVLLSLALPCITGSAWSKDVASAKIIVEDLSDKPCGLTKDSIHGRARLALRQYGIIESATSSPSFYINIIVLDNGSQCVGAVSVSLQGYTSEDFGDGAMGWVKTAKARKTVLASNGSLFFSPRHEFYSYALDGVEELIKETLGEVEY